MTDLRVLPEDGAMAEAVAEALVGRLRATQAEGRAPKLALTGGGIARRVHRALASSGPGRDLDWSGVEFWFGDERYVDSSSEERNARQARHDLLERVAVDPARVHEMPASDSGLSLEAAAAAYADEVRADVAGGFDVVMLGLGPDGHVASLFPGHPALEVRDRAAVGVRGSPKPPPERISLTFPALNRTRAAWFIVAGEEKAEAVSRTQAEGTQLHDVPAVGIKPELAPREVVWWLDAAAASSL